MPSETSLSVGYCVQLVKILPEESLPSLSEFLTTHLPYELESIPRGIISSALKQCECTTSLEKAVKGLQNMLKGMCLAKNDGDSTYGLISGKVIRVIVTVYYTPCI